MNRVFFFFLLVIACTLVSETHGQTDSRGRAIRARDGDTILLPADATVTIVRTVEGRIKLASHGEGRLLIVMIDNGPNPDGEVDSYHRLELHQPFRPEYLWDGPGSVEEYEQVGVQRGRRAIGVLIPAGRILLTSGPPSGIDPPVAPALATFSYKGTGWGPVRGTFADVEQDAILNRSGPQARATLTATPPAALPGMPPPAAPGAPLRVGGSVAAPEKVKDVPAILPDAARNAGVRGVVLLEIVIDREGRVRDAKVLRSIPLLDQAALDAVRQWEFTPPILNGEARELVMTVAVRVE